MQNCQFIHYFNIHIYYVHIYGWWLLSRGRPASKVGGGGMGVIAPPPPPINETLYMCISLHACHTYSLIFVSSQIWSHWAKKRHVERRNVSSEDEYCEKCTAPRVDSKV